MRNGLVILLAVIVSVTGCSKGVKSVDGDISSAAGKPEKSTDIIKEEIVKGNSVKESGIKDPENHIGEFTVAMSGYRGEIFLGISDGVFYGTIKFYNWGNGTPQPLKNLKVNEDRIYFVRSILTREELVRYGGTATFVQEFYGIFSKDGKIIRGYYRYTGTQDSWEAIRK